MKRRLLPLFLVFLVTLVAGCQPPQEFGPHATDVDLWDVSDIRIDTEVPNQYPHGKSGLTGAGAYPGHEYEDENENDDGGDDGH